MPAKKWDQQKVLEIAKQFETRGEFQNLQYGAYQAAYRGGYLDLVCAHMERIVRKAFTKKNVAAIAKNYSTRIEFQEADRSAYNAAIRNKWLEDVCKHMKLLRQVPDKKRIAKIAKQYATRTEFSKADWGSYLQAKRHGWLDEVCKHMSLVQRRPFTKEEVLAIAKKFEGRAVFQRTEAGAYHNARCGGYLDEACAHMQRARHGFNPSKGGWLYHLKFESDEMLPVYKVGITNTSIAKRIRHMALPKGFTCEVLHSVWYENGADALAREKRILAIGRKRGHAYRGRPFLDTGNTELFNQPLVKRG